MEAMSYVFFGLMVIPLLIFLFWIIRKDKNKKHLGLLLLLLGVIIAAFVIVELDKKFMQTNDFIQESQKQE